MVLRDLGGTIAPGSKFSTYEFVASPYGVYPYGQWHAKSHCRPHILTEDYKGMMIMDPQKEPRTIDDGICK